MSVRQTPARTSVRQTPLVRCRALEDGSGTEVYLKLECLQNTGSFKLRGATRAIAALGAEERESGVVTASAGNHGAGLALAGAAAGVSVTVFVPHRTPSNKQERMRSLGAVLRVEGDTYDESELLARRYAEESGTRFVSAFDDDEVMAGNGGSLAEEIRLQLPSVSTVLVPVGGGGLIAGMANELCPNSVRVVGAQPENNCAMHDSLIAGRALCQYEKLSTIAEGCEGAICERTYAVVAKHECTITLVSEAAIATAVAFLFTHCGVVAETSAAVPVAAIREKQVRFGRQEKSVVVISGGNIDSSALDAFLSEESCQ